MPLGLVVEFAPGDDHGRTLTRPGISKPPHDRFDEAGDPDAISPEDDRLKIQRLVELVIVEMKDQDEEVVGSGPRFRDEKLSIMTTSTRQRKIRRLLAALRKRSAEGKDPFGEEGTGLSP